MAKTTTVDLILRKTGFLKDADRGLGDTIENITEATGFKKLVNKMKGGICESCAERKARWNKRFPYGLKSTNGKNV